MAVGQHGNANAEAGQRADQGEAQPHVGDETVDALPQQPVELELGQRPGGDGSLQGAGVQTAGLRHVLGIYARCADVEGGEVGLDAAEHGGKGAVDGALQAPIGIAAVGGGQVVLHLGGGGANEARQHRQARRL